MQKRVFKGRHFRLLVVLLTLATCLGVLVAGVNAQGPSQEPPPPGDPAIELEKTVGTDPSVC
ncbi:MAG: hypothetical protein ACRDIB_10680, partial [Ardenticatenaceae bacterium]